MSLAVAGGMALSAYAQSYYGGVRGLRARQNGGTLAGAR